MYTSAESSTETKKICGVNQKKKEVTKTTFK